MLDHHAPGLANLYVLWHPWLTWYPGDEWACIHRSNRGWTGVGEVIWDVGKRQWILQWAHHCIGALMRPSTPRGACVRESNISQVEFLSKTIDKKVSLYWLQRPCNQPLPAYVAVESPFREKRNDELRHDMSLGNPWIFIGRSVGKLMSKHTHKSKSLNPADL